jgi:hypothetical protein
MYCRCSIEENVRLREPADRGDPPTPAAPKKILIVKGYGGQAAIPPLRWARLGHEAKPPTRARLIICRSQQIGGADTSDHCAYRERDQIYSDKSKIGAIHIHTPEGAAEMGQRKKL